MTRYLFIGGLHRSGTSLLSRLIAQHPDTTAISGSPAPENEGCYLQGAVPHTAQHGRPMHFATDPDQHHIEGGRYDRLEVRQRIDADWEPWFEKGKSWRVEKSPVNLTRMRLYQQLFPMSQFVVILRHPEFVAAAVAKWVDDTPTALVAHWTAAHRQLRADLPYLHAVCVIRYEDLCDRPQPVIRGLHAFMGLPPVGPMGDDVVRAGNRDYGDPTGLTDDLTDWGYAPGGAVRPWAPIIRHPLRDVRDRVAASFADQ